MTTQYPADGRSRVIIENVFPEINDGRFPIKRTPGEELSVKADIFSDGHSKLAAQLLISKDKSSWSFYRMLPLHNDRWIGRHLIEQTGNLFYTLEAWIDHFGSWQEDVKRKNKLDFNAATELKICLEMLQNAVSSIDPSKKEELLVWIHRIQSSPAHHGVEIALEDRLQILLYDAPSNKKFPSRYNKILEVHIDPPKALFSSWYEFFPRSAASDPNSHGTLKDSLLLLEDAAAMGFDIVYLPPIHPIGKQNRKGKNNSAIAHKDDPGSPWSIGAPEGGHKDIHPNLGSLQDMQDFITKASALGLDIALDLALQCSPDHPYVQQHPEWFNWRPDGSIQYAENPPKKYEDIIPFNFECDHWKELWEELASIVIFWIRQGIKIFRVDNPHTKPFHFWEWLIKKIKSDHPEVLFLSEAFTRPKVMKYLAKCGFSQSYTYFTWRTTKSELIEYMTELTQSEAREYLRPNFWPNTPDILPENLQYGGKTSFLIRLYLAACLSSNYGIYGPAYELLIDTPVPGKEEYLHSEKYEIKTWDKNAEHSIQYYIALANRIRSENKALQTTWNIAFHEIDNDHILFFIKRSSDHSNVLLIFINLDPFNTQKGTAAIPIEQLKIDPKKPYLLKNLINDETVVWFGEEAAIAIDPNIFPVTILRLQSKIRDESQFEYF